MTIKSRRKHSATFRVKVALEAVRGVNRPEFCR